MKSLIFAIALNLSLTFALTACSSDAKKTETPKATEVVTAAAPKAVVMKSSPVAKKADKASVPATASTTASAMNCTSGTDSRSLEINSSGTGCELMYSKNGEAKSIATAVNETTYCAGVSEKIVKNLTAAGFSCK